MSTLEIIELVAIAVIALGLGIFYLVKAIKNKWIGQLTDTIKQAIKEAEEKYPEGHGEEKKEYVLTALKCKCDELGIPYDLLYAAFSKLIDKIVEHYNVIKK